MAEEILLGMVVRDKLTGFKGVVTARCEYLHDSTSIRVQSQELTKDGIPVEGQWFNEARLVCIE